MMPRRYVLIFTVSVTLMVSGCYGTRVRETETAEPQIPEERMSRQEDRIDAWWNAFQSKAGDIDALFSRKTEWDLPEWMEEHLQVIHPHLMWEFGPAVHGAGHRLVITPESRRHLRPLVAEIIRRAPQLDGWEFYAYRLAEDYDMAVQSVEARTGGDISQTFVRATIGQFNRIDVVFFADHYTGDDEDAFNDVFVAAESLLGEEILDRWIGVIEVESLPREGAGNLTHIRELKPTVDGYIQQVRSSLPDRPLLELGDEQEWSLFELKPQESDDYPEQFDMFVGKSMIPTMWQNAHSSVSFDSERYSKCCETFCYVKIDGSQGVDEEKFADKSEIEDALDAALREEEIGCFVGGGTGLKYSYVDLALVDVGRGAEIVRQVLREGNIPKRTWLLFYDTDLQARWIGIWDDAPPPPMPEFEDSL